MLKYDYYAMLVVLLFIYYDYIINCYYIMIIKPFVFLFVHNYIYLHPRRTYNINFNVQFIFKQLHCLDRKVVLRIDREYKIYHKVQLRFSVNT